MVTTAWWPALCEPEQALTGPFRSFLVKIASRCNLACSYCYMYEHNDQSWRRRPRVMSDTVIEATATAIARYVSAYKLPCVSIILHGGEPLLVGHERLELICNVLRAAIAPEVEVDIGLQTNGTLLDARFLDLFEKHQIKAGVSLDGPPLVHDRLRVFHGGRGSSSDVESGLRRLAARPSVFGGVVSVIDVTSDPLSVYRYLRSFNPPRIDFLLPDATHDRPPPEPAERYGEWLLDIFEDWYREPEAPSIRIFESVIRLLLGGGTLVESIGINDDDLVVVETDGEIEGLDTLKIAYEGAAATGGLISLEGLRAAETAPAVISRRLGVRSLAQTCQDCSLVSICGGGYQPHRYSQQSGFLNPSVYCAALTRIINTIATRVHRDLSALRMRNS